MFNSCLDTIFTVDEYEIQLDDIIIARFRLLTKKDNYKLINSSIGNFYNNDKGIKPSIAKELSLVLTWWIFDKDITEDNIKNLNKKYLDIIVNEYYLIKNEYEVNYKSYYNNIKQYIGLLENDADRKNMKLLLTNEIYCNTICQNCKQNDICKKKKELNKFLPVTLRVVNYAYLYINEQKEYLFKNKGYEEQPIWFINFLEYAVAQIMKVRESKYKDENNLPKRK